MSDSRDDLAPKPGFESVIESTFRDVPLKVVLGVQAIFSTAVPYAFHQVSQTMEVLLGVQTIDPASFVAAFFLVFFLLPIFYVVLRAGRYPLGLIWVLLVLTATGLLLLTQAGDATPGWVPGLVFLTTLLIAALLLVWARNNVPLRQQGWGLGMGLLSALGLLFVFLGEGIGADWPERVSGILLAVSGGMMLFLVRYWAELPGRMAPFLTGLGILAVFLGLVMLAPLGTHLSISIALLLVLGLLIYSVWFLIQARKPKPQRVPRPIRKIIDGGAANWTIALLVLACVVFVVDRVSNPTQGFLNDFGSVRSDAGSTDLQLIRAVRDQRVGVDSLLQDLQERRSGMASWAFPPDSLGAPIDSVRAVVRRLNARVDSLTALDAPARIDSLRAGIDGLFEGQLAPALRARPEPDTALTWAALLDTLARRDRRVLDRFVDRTGLDAVLADWEESDQVVRIYLEGRTRDYLRAEQTLDGYRTRLIVLDDSLDLAARMRQARVLRGVQTIGAWLFLAFACGLLALWGYSGWSKKRVRQDLINLFFFGAALHLFLLVPLLQEIRPDQIDVDNPIDTVLMSNWFFPHFLKRNTVDQLWPEPSGGPGRGGQGGTAGPPLASRFDEERILERIAALDERVQIFRLGVADTHRVVLDSLRGRRGPIFGDTVLVTLPEDVAEDLEAWLRRVDSTLRALSGDVETLSGDVETLSGDVDGLSRDVGELDRKVGDEVLRGRLPTTTDTLSND